VREIIEGEHFAESVHRLGGYRAIDLALESVIEALVNNPYAFPFVENDWCRIRYAQTKPIEGYIPPLVIAFAIDEQKNVVLEWVDVIDEAELSG
jgi:hypothetical protein